MSGLLGRRYDSVTQKTSRGEPSEDTDSVMKRIDSKTRHRLKRFIQGVIFMSVMIVIMELDWKIRGPETMRHLNMIEGELGELRPFPNALLLSKNPHFKGGSSQLDATYVVQGVPATSIEHWYNEELQRQNWRPLSVTSRQSRRILEFCRNEESVFLFLPENSSGPDTKFTIDIRWGEGTGECWKLD
jgi:hypothetical protein